MNILNGPQTAQVLPYSKLVRAIERVAFEKAQNQIYAPERHVIPINDASVLLSIPAIGQDISVTKVITVHANNAAHQLPVIQGEVIVFDTATGRRLALLDAPTVTARRTAAVTLLGIETLAPKKPSSVLLIGTGTQARAHAEALMDYFGVQHFYVSGSSLSSAVVFCNTLCSQYPTLVAKPVAVDVHTQFDLADIIIALTTSKQPVIPIYIPSDTLAIGVGAFKPDMAEFPEELLHRRAIVVDDLAGAKHEAGDLIQAGIDWSHVRELAQIKSMDQELNSELPVFKTVGQAAWDLAAARVALASL